jgi:hypothetical protein
MNELFEPYENILTREIEDELTRKELASYADAIDKLVSIGTHLLKWEMSGDVDETTGIDETVILSVTFKRLLEILDSISLQVRVGAVNTAVIHLRVLFELGVQFEYVMMSSDVKQRCHCMLMTDWYRRLEEINKILPSEQSDEEKEAVGNLKSLINLPQLSLIKSEYDSLRSSKRKGEIKWYNLFDPKLSDFSKLVDQKFSKYKKHYKAISKGFGNDAVHSTNLLRGNITNSEGDLALIQMRNHSEAIGLAGIAFYIGKICCEQFKNRRSREKKSKYIAAIMECEKTHKDVAFPGLYEMKSGSKFE